MPFEADNGFIGDSPMSFMFLANYLRLFITESDQHVQCTLLFPLNFFPESVSFFSFLL